MATTKTTSEMRTMVRNMQSILKAYDDAEKAMMSSRNCRDYDNAQNLLKNASLEIEMTMENMVHELNCLLSYADAIGIRDYYKMEMKTI